MWAHWGPQCQSESDWYARGMYQEGSWQYKIHLQKYGHPSKFGLKDVINEWKAEKWNAEELVSLYKNAGAQYFMALANHHGNLDCTIANIKSIGMLPKSVQRKFQAHCKYHRLKLRQNRSLAHFCVIRLGICSQSDKLQTLLNFDRLFVK